MPGTATLPKQTERKGSGRASDKGLGASPCDPGSWLRESGVGPGAKKVTRPCFHLARPFGTTGRISVVLLLLPFSLRGGGAFPPELTDGSNR